MSGLDVEALLDSAAASKAPDTEVDRHRSERAERRERDHDRDDSRDRDRRRRSRTREHDRRRDDDNLRSPRSERGSANGSHRSRHRSRSRDGGERRRSHRDDDGHRRRSRSPRDDRYYRPGSRRDDDRRDRDRHERRRSRSPRKDVKKEKTPEPQLTEDERDRRTVFVQQLAARLRTKELIAFFEKVGPVKEAQIVKDRVSGRSKG
jgi:RNA-binding protein 23/39